MSRIVLLLISSLLAISCSAQTQKNSFQQHVDEFVTDSVFLSAGVGIVISDTETGTILATNQRYLGLTPASIQKLITTATALEILGSNYQFKTQIETNGEILANGTLNGNLIIRGFGDPTLGSKFFPEHSEIQILQQLKSLNIKNIKGKIITDASYLKSTIPPTWIWEDIGNYYGAVPNGLSYKDNMYTLFFKSGAAGSITKILKTEPQNTGLEFDNQVVSSNINRDLAYIFGGNTSNKRRITGSIPQNRSSFKVKGALLSPETCLKNELTKLLHKSDISIENKVISKTKTQTLFILQSPHLKDIVKITNKKSVNLFADHLLFEIGAKQKGIANWNSGINATKEYWKAKGIKTKYISLFDGSGLSHFNSVSAGTFNDILQIMYKSNSSKEFVSSLAVSGTSGTLKSFGKNSSIKGKWIAKTGSMTGVRTYCGYLTNKNGKVYAVSILINNHSCPNSYLNNKLLNLLNKLYNS